MSSLVARLRNGPQPRTMVDREAFIDGYPFDDPTGAGVVFRQTLIGNRETIAPTYLDFASRAYLGSPTIFALMANRSALFSEARFQYRRRDNGRPGPLFGDQSLLPLERPWAGGTTGDLLRLAELHNSLAGNFFAAARGGGLRVMRPDWTAIVLGSEQEPSNATDLDAEVVGYLYQEGGPGSGNDPVALLPSEVIHYFEHPDPECPYIGVSWITAVIQELLADKQMTSHKRKYLEAGATPNLAIMLDVEKLGITSPDEFTAWVKAFEETRTLSSGGNPYKTLFVAAASDPRPLGANLDQVDFAKIQAQGEVRIAAAAMVHPAIAGFTEGLQGSALNSGNLGEAWRQFANGWARPSWRKFSGAAQVVLKAPVGAELWYDDRDIPALEEDSKKRAEVTQIEAATLASLITTGFTPESSVTAVVSNDLSGVQHTGLVSVQLLPPGQAGNPAAAMTVTLPGERDRFVAMLAAGWTILDPAAAAARNGKAPVPA